MDKKNYKPSGLFIEEDEKGQIIYNDPFIKGGFLIHKSKYNNYRTYALRYLLGIIVVIIVSTFISLRPSIIVGILTILVGELLFRIKFLKTCVYLPNYKSTKEVSLFNTLTSSTTKSKKLIKSILFLALAILLVINAYEQNYEQYIIIISWIISIISFILAIIFLIAYIKDKGE